MMRAFILIMMLFPVILFGQGAVGAWQNYSLGIPSLQISLPGTPTPQNTKLPQSVRVQVREYMSAYLKNVPEGLVTTMMYAEYAPDIVSDAKGALDGTNKQWESTGSKVSIIATQDIKVSGRAAIKQQGKLVNGNEQHDFTDIVVVQGNKLWQVIIMAKAGDPSLQTISQKIASSLAF